MTPSLRDCIVMAGACDNFSSVTLIQLLPKAGSLKKPTAKAPRMEAVRLKEHRLVQTSKNPTYIYRIDLADLVSASGD
ncbi:methyltransferase type 11 [Pseudomonas sp. Os17]|nr:methyltransferase type 11 [Pseudomonas sp. Os17]